MNNVKKALLATALTFGFASMAQATTYTAADDSAASKLCATAATASKMQMHREVAGFTSNIMTAKNYRLIANELYCNGQNVADFARQAGNIHVAEKLETYRSKYVQIRDIASTRNGNVHVGSK